MSQIVVNDSEVSEIKQEIGIIEDGLADNSLSKLFSETKKSSVLYLAEQYERLYELEASEVPTNQIANHLVKKFRKLRVSIADSTVYDNLPQKYKTHIPNPSENDDGNSENRSENSSLISINYEQENALLIEYWTNHLATVKMIISKLNTTHFTSKLNSKELHEDLKLMNFANQVIRDCIDDRKSMPTSTQHIALRVFAEEPAKYAANVYVNAIKVFGGLKKKEAVNNLMSFKQFRKFLTGKVKELRDLYVPKSKDDAMERGYYGMRCTDMQCKSWRVFHEPSVQKYLSPVMDGNGEQKLDEKQKPLFIKKSRLINRCKCYACGRVMKPRTERLPKETPGITIDYHKTN